MIKKSPKVAIQKVALTGKDPRGYVWQWQFKDGRQVSIFFRKKGVHFAHHYHTGIDPSKNPERFFLVSGRVRVTWWNSRDKKYTRTVRAGSEITIPKMIPHCFDALTDCVFLEYRTTHFNPKYPDTIPLSGHNNAFMI